MKLANVAGLILVLALAVLSRPQPLRAQAGAIAAGMVGRTLMEDASTQAHSLLLSAQHNANASIARLANELSVAAENARIALSSDLDKRYDQLSAENRKLIDRVNALLEESRRIQVGVVNLKDAAVLDLADIMDDSWLSSGRVGFFVQRIDGIVQLQRPLGHDYVVGVLGLGFGPSSSDRITDVEWIKLGQELVSLRSQKPRAHYTEFTIPGALLEPLFQPRRLASVQFQVGVVVRTPRTLSSIFGYSEERHFVTVQLSLLSRYAGSIVVYSEAPTEEWVNAGPVSYAVASPTVGNWQAFQAQTSVDENHRFVGPLSYGHHSHGCGWTKDHVLEITNQDRTLRLMSQIQGASCSYTYNATLQKRAPGANATAKAERDLEYGGLVTIDLPSGAKFWTVKGTSATGVPIDLVKCTSDATLRCEDDTEVGAVRKVTYRVLPPAGVAY